MKRTLTTVDLDAFPTPFRGILEGARVYDSSCSPEARVLFIDRDGGYYLKSAPACTLAREAEMTRYFHQKGLATQVLDYVSDTRDFLLTARLAGEDCTHADYTAEPRRLCDLLATTLRALHGEPHAACPVPDRTGEYLATVEENHRKGIFDAAYLPRELRGMTADEAFSLVEREGHRLGRDVLLHGDYCLPNILLDGWRFSGFIDLDHAGVGDRHIDLFWGVWTLEFNLKTDRYAARFLDAYGRDAVDADLLRVIGAAECFG